MTKARLIQHYVRVVKIDRLPPPFNLVQWVVTAPFAVVECCYYKYSRARSSLCASSSSPPPPPPFCYSSSSSGLPCSSFSPELFSFSGSPISSDPASSTRKHNPKSHGLVKLVRSFFGRIVFWLMMGPIAVCAGWALWAVSILKAPLVVWETSADKSLCR